MLKLNNCIVLRYVLLVNDLDNFHNFLHQLSHALDHSRCAVADVSTLPHLPIVDVVIHFGIQDDSFRVSTSSAIAIKDVAGVSLLVPKLHTRAQLAPLLRTVKHVHRCLLLHFAVSNSNRPIADSFHISSTRFQTCNRLIVDSFPDFDVSLWFEWHSTPDLTLDLRVSRLDRFGSFSTKSAVAATADTAGNFQRSWSVCCCC